MPIPLLDRYTVYIDESGTPHFNASLKDEEGYVVCATIIPNEEQLAARTFLPRRPDGRAVKASDKDATDVMCATLLRKVFSRTHACAAVVTLATRDAHNETLASDIYRARRFRDSSAADLVRLLAAKDAYVNSASMPLRGDLCRFVDVVFDRGSERPAFQKYIREELFNAVARRQGAGIGDVRWQSTAVEPLTLLSDWIAGAVRLDSKNGALPMTRAVLGTATSQGRLQTQIGFKVKVPRSNSA